MPKILDETVMFVVVCLFCAGFSRDKIADNLKIGQGTVSKYLAEFRKIVGDEQYNTIKNQGIYLRQNKTSIQDATEGAKLVHQLNEYKITKSDILAFLNCLDQIKSEQNPVELLAKAKELLKLSKDTGKGFAQVVSQYEKMHAEIPALESQKMILQSEIAELEQTRREKLKQNHTTDSRLAEYSKTKQDMKKIGIAIEDLPNFKDAIMQIKQRNYDVQSTLEDLQTIGNLKEYINTLERQIKDKEKQSDHINEEIKHLKTILESLKKEYKSYSSEVKVIQSMIKNNQDPSSIVSWNKILKDSNMKLAEFEQTIKLHGSLLQYMKKLKLDIKSLKQKAAKLQSQIESLSLDKEQLERQNIFAKRHLDEKIVSAVNAVKQMYENPLRLVREDTKPKDILPLLSIFFGEMSEWAKKHSLDSLLDHISHIKSEIDRHIEGK